MCNAKPSAFPERIQEGDTLIPPFLVARINGQNRVKEFIEERRVQPKFAENHR